MENLKTFRVFYKNGQQLTVKAAKIQEGSYFNQYGFVLLDENGKIIEGVYLPNTEILYIIPVDVVVPPGGIKVA